MHRTHALTAGMLAIGLALSLALTACGGGSTGAGTEAPNFKLSITDAPFPGDLVESATVVIREVRLRDEAAGGWQVVFDGSAEIDLVPLTGGVVSTLAELDIPAGTYDEIRLIVDAGEVVLSDDAYVRADSHVFDSENGGLHFPSGAQTGVKVKLDAPIVVVTELSTEVTLDFDLSKNFVFNGSPEMAPGVRRVIFTPVVRAVNSTTAGSVGVEFVSDGGTPDDEGDDAPLAGAEVRALDSEGAEAASGVSDELGGMVFQLAPGVYTLEVAAANHETTTTEAFEVFLGNRTTLGAVLVAATAGELTGVVMSDGLDDTDDADDTVVAGASVAVTLEGETTPAATTTTDENGAFRFESLALGSYDVAVTAPGFADGEVAGVAPSLGGTAVGVTLTPYTRSVTGTVTDDATLAVDGATVVVANAAGVEIGSTTTATDGTYAISLPTGLHEVTFTNPANGATTTIELSVAGTDPETDQTLDAQLPAAP